jgi:hypothetical protein
MGYDEYMVVLEPKVKRPCIAISSNSERRQLLPNQLTASRVNHLPSRRWDFGESPMIPQSTNLVSTRHMRQTGIHLRERSRAHKSSP